MITLSEIKQNPAARDAVFVDVLSYFNGAPMNILEVGCLRDIHSRKGDGWSSVFWAEYVVKFGGIFCTTNTSQADLNVCSELIYSLFPDRKTQFNFLDVDGLTLIDKTFNFIYLDGGDDPNDTLNQFNCCDLDTQYVLVDDFHTKGSLLPQDKIHTLYDFTNGHKMALFYGKNPITKIISVSV